MLKSIMKPTVPPIQRVNGKVHINHVHTLTAVPVGHARICQVLPCTLMGHLSQLSPTNTIMHAPALAIKWWFMTFCLIELGDLSVPCTA